MELAKPNENFSKRTAWLLLEQSMLLLDGQSQSEKNFSFGRQTAVLAFLNPIQSQRRNAGQARELGLAQHLSFANFSDVVLWIHATAE